jgi:hypothetical protein
MFQLTDQTAESCTISGPKLFLEIGSVLLRDTALGASPVRSLSTGSALVFGKTRALRITGANRAWGQRYSKEFSGWMFEHGFGEMPKSVRSVCIELVENEPAISVWRDTLSERQRRKWRHPVTLTRHWRATQPPSDPPDGVASIKTTRSIATNDQAP